MKFGAQLYSLRNFIKTESDIDETFGKIKAMGYDNVQFSGADFNAESLKKTIDKYDLPVNLTHIPAQRLLEDTDKVIEEHKIIGCDYIGLGAMPNAFPFTGGLKEVDEFIADFEKVAKKISDAGLRFSYHHHDFEFRKLENGMTIFDYIAERAEHFMFTLDTYWLQRGGVSILEYIDKMKGRIDCVHLKDMMTIAEGGQKFAPLGVGVINFRDVIPAMEKAGAKYAFVEQDDAVTYPDPFGQMAISADYLKDGGWLK